MYSVFISRTRLLWTVGFLICFLVGYLVVGWFSPLNAQSSATCSTPIECFTLGQQKLQQAQEEIRLQKLELQDKLKELEQLKSQLTDLQSKLASVNDTVSNTTNSASAAVQKAQETADAAQASATKAQNTANSALDLANQINGRTRSISFVDGITIIDAGGKYLAIQSDGNVVVYRDNPHQALWASRTAN